MHFQNFIFSVYWQWTLYRACIDFTYSNEALPTIKETNTLLEFGIWLGVKKVNLALWITKDFIFDSFESFTKWLASMVTSDFDSLVYSYRNI